MKESPSPPVPGIAAGITEAMIRELVHRFYDLVRQDPLLGPVFEEAVSDWDVHLDKLCRFWSSVTLMSGRYRGTPMQAHAALPGIRGEHFDRWLELFRETAVATCPSGAAELFVDRAQRIGQSLELGIANHRRQLPGLGDRLIGVTE